MIILKNHFNGNDTAIFGDIVSNGCQTFHIHQLNKICKKFNVPEKTKQEVLKYHQENLGENDNDISADIFDILQAENNATLNNAVAFATTDELLLEKMLDYFKDDEHYPVRLIIAERADISATLVQKLAHDPDPNIRTAITRY